VELGDFFWGIVNVSGVLPSVAFHTVALPFDQILESASEHPAVNDFFHDIFLFTVYEFWRWLGRSESAWDRVRRSQH